MPAKTFVEMVALKPFEVLLQARPPGFLLKGDLGVSETKGYLILGSLNKDPTI